MHKPSDNGHDEDDILGLIADIHGTTPPEQQAMERALGTLENGARHASAAMQRFERTGRTHRTQPPTRLPENAPPVAAAADASPEVTQMDAPRAPESAEVTQMYRPVPPQAPGATDAASAMSAEVTQFYAPAAPHRGAPPAAVSGAAPTPPAGLEARPALPAEVLGGRGAEFIDIGHTRTHIRAPIKPTKK